jgi:pSer/pThr/pTyr-binding forkhead associated (FHA) protein
MPEAPPPPVASPAERAQRRQERVTERTLAGEALDLTVNIDPRLIVERSPVAPTGVVFPLSGPVTVGRAPTSDITLDETFVSQTHARLILRGQFYFVEDLGSTNGTFVNEKEVSEAQLKPDSRLRIGETVFRYEE